MNDNWVNDCVTEYYKWLRNNTLITKNEQTGWYAITTPFLGLFNDNIEIYVKMDNNRIMLSDDGQTLSNLKLTGYSITQSGKKRINMILLNYGIKRVDCELKVESTKKDFNQKKHNLLRAILEISTIAMLDKRTVTSLCNEVNNSL
jgi:hypothetical protein